MSAISTSLESTLLASFPDPLLLVDSQGIVRWANPAASGMFGFSVEELTGLAVDQLVPDRVRDRHQAHRHDFARKSGMRPMSTRSALTARRRDGSEVVVEITLNPMEFDGESLVVASVRSVGDYSRVQEALQRVRYAEAVASMGQLAVDAPDDEILLSAIPAAAAEAMQIDTAVLYLLEPGEREFRVVGGVGLVDDERVGALVPNVAQTSPGFMALHGQPITVDDYRLERRFQPRESYLRQGFVSALSMPLIERGKVIGALAARSTQERRFREEELRFLSALGSLVMTILQRQRSEAALRHAQRLESVGQLTGGIAHDFNNLLTVIRGNVEMLQELPFVSEDLGAHQFADAAMRATNRAAELTGKLLAFSRRQHLQPESIEIGSLLYSLADMLRRTFDKRIAVEVDVAPDCPRGRADPGQLENALLNIAVNARDAMPEGGSLRFSVRGVDAGRVVEIAVSDTGGGMSEDVQQRAFEPFFTTKASGRGTGLGLSTAFGFARQSGGNLSISSVRGAGTTLVLSIPASELAPLKTTEPPARMTVLKPGLDVLLVEDDAEVRQVVEGFLRALRCTVRSVGGAEEAWELIARGHPPQLLLSDISLGAGQRGTELAARVNRAAPDVVVLLMSGFSDEELSASDGGKEHKWPLLHKPFSRDEMARAIARCTGQ